MISRSPGHVLTARMLVLTLLAGCSTSIATLRPRGTAASGDAIGRQRGPGLAGLPDGLGGGRTADGRDTARISGPRDRVRTAARSGAGMAEQRVCRTSSVPRGWITVAYERSANACPARVAGDSSANAAVIVRYASAPINTRLDVCADQVTPAGWTTVRDEAVEDAGACPGAARSGQITVRRIRRDF